ncbi:MAG TPA: cytochrome b/b6 domain-containing protein [Vicinamibacterales bacterium]|nr:cytochrome b/b6 domain-containing protein [Vicinamibacterales bacterium]
MNQYRPPLVLVTHWLTAVAVFALMISGVAILLAHPRLYWGETGTLGTPSLIDLPLPMVLTGQTGWGRSLHFLAAWVIVLSGVSYVAAGVPRRYFRWPDYNGLQRRTYAIVVFFLAPLAVWTGLAMSPAVESVMPSIVTLLGGHQSARTIHFVAASLITLFVAGHIVMIATSGFTARMRGMIVGSLDVARDRPLDSAQGRSAP